LTSKYVPVAQAHVDPVNVNVGAHAEQVVDAPEQAVHFESHWEHSLTLKYVPTAQPHVDPANVNVAAQAEQLVDVPEQRVHDGSHGEH
jgi:hypothetical protein